MTFKPMLANSAQRSSFDKYIADDGWVAEQKLDGKRLLLQVEDGNVTVVNRYGVATSVDHTIAEPFTSLTGRWCFDGEEIHNQFWIFDMPYALDLVSPKDEYDQRRKSLEAVFGAGWSDHPRLKLIDVAHTEPDKRALFDWVESHEGEGVMFKNRAGLYQPGKRSHSFLKAKFTETVDCVIMEIMPKGKSSCVVGLFRDPSDPLPVEVGSVKMTESNLKKVALGQVIEVKYLNFTRDEKLYQANFLKFRTDKLPHDCLLDDNLRRVNKTIHVPERT